MKKKKIEHDEMKYNEEDYYNVDDEIEELLRNNRKDILKNEISTLFDDLNVNDKAINDSPSVSYETIRNNFKLQNRVVSVFCNNIVSDIKIKKFYSKFLIGILILQFVALDVVFFLAGKGIIIVSDVSLNLFVGGGLLEIVGLVTIIVKYLFNDNTAESLRIISRINKFNFSIQKTYKKLKIPLVNLKNSYKRNSKIVKSTI